MHHQLQSLVSSVLLAYAALSTGASALAMHAPGATYSGTVAGGGTMHFTVSGDGTTVAPFGGENVQGNSCSFTSFQVNSIPITNHSFSYSSSVFNITGSFPSAGTAQGTLRLNAGGCDSGTQNWTATRPNAAPTLDPIGNRAVDEGQLLQFSITSTDPDGDPVTYSAANLPPGANFDPSTHQFSWTPSYSQHGTYPNVHFQVTDGSASDSEDIEITVNDLNGPPSLAPIGNKNVAEGSTLSFAISATDPEADAITYSASSLPAGASFDPATQQFSWTPSFLQDGSYSSVHFQASDGNGADTEDITITVSNVLQAMTMTLATKLKPASILASGMLGKPLRGRVPITVTLFDQEAGRFVKADTAKPKTTPAGDYAATLDRPDGPMCKVTARFPGDHDYKPKTVTKKFSC